jgi:hypothetical protein
MFEEWKRVWREAVENFHREAGADAAAGRGTLEGGRRHVAMRREISEARAELRKLENELTRAERELQEQRDAEGACHRRQAQAERIGDGETARLAAAFATRHADRALILVRKVEVLVSERTVRTQDLQDMELALQEVMGALEEASGDETDMPSGAQAQAAPAGHARARVIEDEEFVTRKAEREARERAAEARLEELKKRMR